jgi:hypothetical protein
MQIPEALKISTAVAGTAATWAAADSMTLSPPTSATAAGGALGYFRESPAIVLISLARIARIARAAFRRFLHENQATGAGTDPP